MILMIFGPLFQILKHESIILHGKKITEDQFLQKGFITFHIGKKQSSQILKKLYLS